MGRAPLERLTIRAALMVGFGLVFGLWLVTGWAFTRHLTTVEEQGADLTARYMRAQDLLSAIRGQLNLNSIILRDALLDTSPASRPTMARRLADNEQAIDAALEAYQPVHADTPEQLRRLRDEVADFRRATHQILEAEGGGADPVALLGSAIAPRRAAAIALSDDIRALNRRAFVQHQLATAELHRDVERRWWWTLGGAMGTSVAIALLAVLYAGRLESRLQRQRQRDQQSARELQELSQRLVAVQEEERRHIARELHDEVGQALSAIKVDLLLAQRDLERRGEPLATCLDSPQRMADEALHVVRDLSQLLRPAVLDDLGLAAAVDGLLRGLSRRHHVHVELVTESLPHRLPADIEVTAFRIIQEALTNVARHSGATRCLVRIARHDDLVTLSVDDNGCGFDLRRPRTARQGLGLLGLRERVAERHGTIDIATAPGEGTRLLVSLPLAHGDADDRVLDPAASLARQAQQVSHG